MPQRAFSTLEMALALALIVLSVLVLIQQTGLLHLVLVRISANGLEGASRNWKTQAVNNNGLVLVFRPRGGPYQTVLISPPERDGVIDRVPLQRGVYLVNTNGLIVNDELILDGEGRLQRKAKDVPVVTVASPHSAGVIQLIHDGSTFDRRR